MLTNKSHELNLSFLIKLIDQNQLIITPDNICHEIVNFIVIKMIF